MSAKKFLLTIGVVCSVIGFCLPATWFIQVECNRYAFDTIEEEKVTAELVIATYILTVDEAGEYVLLESTKVVPYSQKKSCFRCHDPNIIDIWEWDLLKDPHWM